MRPKEHRRQVLHLIIGSVFLFLVAAGVAEWWLFFGLLVGAYGLIILGQVSDLFRLHRFLGWAQRRYDRRDSYLPLWGLLSLIKGFLVATALFPDGVAVPALAVLVYGDAFATLVGRDAPSPHLPWHPRKTVAGLLGGTAAATLVLSLFLPFFPALLASFAGMLVESLPRPQPLLDDNLVIPLASGLVLILL